LPGPKYMGGLMPNSADSVEWKRQQLIRQQKLFVAEQNEKRQQLIRQQQAFATDQNEKRAQLLKQQQVLMAEQTGSLPQQKLKLQKLPMQKMKALKGDSSMRYGYRKSYNNYPLEPVIANVISDLVSESIIKDKTSLSSFKLTNTFLTVNGIKQPDAVHEKLRDKYLKNQQYPADRDILDDPQYGLHYDAKNGDMGIGISINKNDP
jgi:bla regulator protein BlaR1